MTDGIKKGEVVDQVRAEWRASLCTRSLGAVWGAPTGLEGRLLFWQRAANAVASGGGDEGLTHLPRHLQET